MSIEEFNDFVEPYNLKISLEFQTVFSTINIKIETSEWDNESNGIKYTEVYSDLGKTLTKRLNGAIKFLKDSKSQYLKSGRKLQ